MCEPPLALTHFLAERMSSDCPVFSQWHWTMRHASTLAAGMRRTTGGQPRWAARWGTACILRLAVLRQSLLELRDFA